MGGVEQLAAAQAAEGALRAVGVDHALSESALVQAPTHGGGQVGPPGLGAFGDARQVDRCDIDRRQVVHGDLKAERFGALADHVDRPDGEVAAGDHPVKVDQRPLELEQAPQAGVVTVVRIGAAVAVEQVAGGAEGVVVGRVRCDGDRERQLHQARLEDPLGGNEGNAVPFKVEPALEQIARQHVAVQLGLLGQPQKGGKAELEVGVQRRYSTA